MLRVISSKLAQRTPGDLSIPGSDQDVLQPYKSVGRFVGREVKRRKQEKLRNRPYQWLARYESLRDPMHGMCRNCGKPNAINERGTPFCPSPECNMTRPRFT